MFKTPFISFERSSGRGIIKSGTIDLLCLLEPDEPIIIAEILRQWKNGWCPDDNTIRWSCMCVCAEGMVGEIVLSLDEINEGVLC